MYVLQRVVCSGLRDLVPDEKLQVESIQELGRPESEMSFVRACRTMFVSCFLRRPFSVTFGAEMVFDAPMVFFYHCSDSYLVAINFTAPT